MVWLLSGLLLGEGGGGGADLLRDLLVLLGKQFEQTGERRGGREGGREGGTEDVGRNGEVRRGRVRMEGGR